MMRIKASTILLSGLVFSLVAVSCLREPYKVVPYSDIDYNLINTSELFYYELFKACEADNLELFINQDFLTPTLIHNLKNGNYKNTCLAVHEHIGEISSIKLIEAIYFKSIFWILRYQITGTKLEEAIEFRMTLSLDNKLSDYQFYSWSDTYDNKLDAKDWY